MQIDKLRSLVNYESPTNRTAELAALFTARSLEVDEVDELAFEQMANPTAGTSFSLAPAYAARIAEKLVSIGEVLNTLAVIDCNTGLSPAQERNRERNAEMAIEIGTALGFNVETTGDPRGHVLKLFDPNDERLGDGWGGGWPVYRS